MKYLWQPQAGSGDDQKESTSRYHFIALFLTAGVLSSLASHIYTLGWKLPRALATGAGRHAILPSLGASGAIYATIVVTALGERQNLSWIITSLSPASSFPGKQGRLNLFTVLYYTNKRWSGRNGRSVINITKQGLDALDA